MTSPTVTELPLALEPVIKDTFLDGLENLGPATPHSMRTRLPGRGFDAKSDRYKTGRHPSAGDPCPPDVVLVRGVAGIERHRAMARPLTIRHALSRTTRALAARRLTGAAASFPDPHPVHRDPQERNHVPA